MKQISASSTSSSKSATSVTEKMIKNRSLYPRQNDIEFNEGKSKTRFGFKFGFKGHPHPRWMIYLVLVWKSQFRFGIEALIEFGSEVLELCPPLAEFQIWLKKCPFLSKDAFLFPNN